MNIVYLLLGSNLDDRVKMLGRAGELIHERVGCITHRSSVYESEPWGFISNEVFLNQAIRLETELSASTLLEEIHEIENELGRKRQNGHKYQSRTIDVDILFYNDEIIAKHDLMIPHPLLSERMFALLPLYELDSKLIHPSFQKTIEELIHECHDPLRVEPYPET